MIYFHNVTNPQKTTLILWAFPPLGCETRLTVSTTHLGVFRVLSIFVLCNGWVEEPLTLLRNGDNSDYEIICGKWGLGSCPPPPKKKLRKSHNCDLLLFTVLTLYNIKIMRATLPIQITWSEVKNFVFQGNLVSRSYATMRNLECWLLIQLGS